VPQQQAPLQIPGTKERNDLFDRIDFNGNGGLSLAEIDKAVVELWPQFNHKRALMRAYRAADSDQNGYITRKEFGSLLESIRYFNELAHLFDTIDRDNDHRLDLDEFMEGCALVLPELQLSADAAAAEFRKMDENGGGVVLFDEFCAWALEQHLDHIEEEQRQRQLSLQQHAQHNSFVQRHTSARRQRPQRQPQLEPMRRRLLAMSYGRNGIDPANLFSLYDRDNSGELDYKEFRNVVRKGGQVTPAQLSEQELRTLFEKVDTDNSGCIHLDELTAMVWGEGGIGQDGATEPGGGEGTTAEDA
jgi:Ca2+-binding EF-hand superfamily protein